MSSSSSSSKPKLLIVWGEHRASVARYLVNRSWEHTHGRDWKHLAYEQPLLDLAKALYPREIDDLALECHPTRGVIQPHLGRPNDGLWSTNSVLQTLEAILDDNVALPRPRFGRTVLLETLVARIQEARKYGRPNIVVTVEGKLKADLLREALPSLFPHVCFMEGELDPKKIADALAAEEKM